MGKKTKVGEQRKDKFYHLAKKTGYRSRAASKLIQLNRKFEFLQKSKVLVDLCAAPGGWMQVAIEHMPVESIVIGVDLSPIKPVAGCISIQEDITTPRCLSLLKKELKTWKVDVILNDGAPNVGQNWIHDAYQQACLTLSALKLATELLKPGGFFITKVFRSKDYNSLIWVFQQLFKTVFSTKPAASRIETTEIFVVCKDYLAPPSIDPLFLNPEYVLEDVEIPEGQKQLRPLLMEVGKKKKAEGCPTGENLLYKPINASEFVRSSDYIDLLANTSQIILDEEWIEKNSKTTPDIVDYCKDVKVLGRKEIKSLISWRKSLSDKLNEFDKLKGENSQEIVTAVTEVEDESDTLIKLDEQIAVLKLKIKEAKRKRRKMKKERKKISEKTSLEMIIPGDIGPTDTSEDTLFTLKSLKTGKDVESLTDKPTMPIFEEPELDDDVELKIFEEKRPQFIKSKEDEILDSSGRYYKNMDSVGEDPGMETDGEEDPDLKTGLGINENEKDLAAAEDFAIDEVAPVTSHTLITDFDHRDKSQKRLRKAQIRFDKNVFKDIENHSDEDLELKKLPESFVENGAEVVGYDSKTEIENQATKKKTRIVKPKKRKMDELEVVTETEKKKKKVKHDFKKPVNDDFEPNFVGFEVNGFIYKLVRKKVLILKQLVEDDEKDLEDINARPIKKVVEAMNRKKKRAVKKLEKTKKDAEAVLEKEDMTEAEKANQLKQLYKELKGKGYEGGISFPPFVKGG